MSLSGRNDKVSIREQIRAAGPGGARAMYEAVMVSPKVYASTGTRRKWLRVVERLEDAPMPARSAR